MATLIRQVIANKVAAAVDLVQSPLTGKWKEHVHKLPWCVRLKHVTKKTDPKSNQVIVPLKHLSVCGLVEEAAAEDHRQWLCDITHKISQGDGVEGVESTNKSLEFSIAQRDLHQIILQEIQYQKQFYGFLSPFHCYCPLEEGGIVEEQGSQKLVVEYSSPNIAKRFHAGHLRSTILGNFIANLYENLGHRVTRLNYLGDWGTQFGLLGVGFQKYGSKDQLQTNAMQHLFDIYVKTNKEAKQNEEVRRAAKQFFKQMEQGDEECLALWRLCRDKSIEEYSAMYKRLGVHFDEYTGESAYCQQSLSLIQDLQDKGMLEVNRDTGLMSMPLMDDTGQTFHVSLTRSDGSTLYITRDIAAAIDRKNKYNFNKMFYVVEKGQRLHFQHLAQTLRRLGQGWAGQPLDRIHVAFGRVEGMSTRTGDVVFLSDILDEAKSRMLSLMKQKETTKVESGAEFDEVAERLGTSAIIVQDMKARRLQNYKFSWDRMLSFKGDTGVFLQYSHARLCNIKANAPMEIPSVTSVDLSTLQEPSASRLVLHLARFDEVLQHAQVILEPCYLAQYLFDLSRLAHVVCDELYVRGQPDDLAKPRLVLFDCARIVLANGMRTLGIEPLDKL